ncbi:DoxX family protein [Enemella evansiae]|uniref:DoxX family protein n=1 Tax=Enemella evansiae TaxID=2016499 RepID=UPI000B9663AE|nr:DoxX family protein [Enemella evansiae]OYN94018.1 hypothetical protein CGZ96_19295 [Enemella evansiae]OYN95305.1 hypothetical protein CGZ95_16320 [Enemella evansiae]OYO03408.1 hypothetical protein CGZ97_08085 [Enemella evansiae]PFG68697.1 putative membrane protein YphA (DoxX/SURF4 family) [Propionibacteriaceae bacterium ES.041]
MASNPEKDAVSDDRTKPTRTDRSGVATDQSATAGTTDSTRSDTPAGASRVGAASGASDRTAPQTSRSTEQLRDDSWDRRQAFTELELTRANNRRTTDLGILVLRVAALLVLTHGLSKLGNFSGFRNTVAQTAIGAPAPDLVALLQIAAEVALPIALFLGILTRISGLLLAISMTTVWLLMHLLPNLSTPLTSSGGLQGEPALLFALIGLTLFFTGGGRFSVDRLVLGKRLQDRAERRAEKRA